MIFKPEFIENGFFSEYPRPQLKRQSFFNLCGEWDYAITKTSDLLDSFEGKILVPFCPESKLSGVNRQLKKDEFLHLSKHFALPQGFNRGRVILNVGAIDQCAKIYLNGKLL
ncbi:MAG: glycoside hydrolase family 2, partial [Clostridia bacterium]|nr:glycoside hydrolase family 2 [Clostridia bacterium]